MQTVKEKDFRGQTGAFLGGGGYGFRVGKEGSRVGKTTKNIRASRDCIFAYPRKKSAYPCRNPGDSSECNGSICKKKEIPNKS